MNSFLEGRPSVSRQGLPVERATSQLPAFGQPAANGAGHKPSGLAPAPGGHGEKKIETVEVDGIVQKIIVTCACGERIEVHCGY